VLQKIYEMHIPAFKFSGTSFLRYFLVIDIVENWFWIQDIPLNSASHSMEMLSLWS